jgi:hypothetical protein
MRLDLWEASKKNGRIDCECYAENVRFISSFRIVGPFVEAVQSLSLYEPVALLVVVILYVRGTENIAV